MSKNASKSEESLDMSKNKNPYANREPAFRLSFDLREIRDNC